jgi:hypothetical protein
MSIIIAALRLMFKYNLKRQCHKNYDLFRYPVLSPDGLAVVDQKGLRGSFAAIFAGCLTSRTSNHLVDKIGTKFFQQPKYLNSLVDRIRNKNSSQCCGSGSGIRRLFDPWIRDPE